MTTLISEKLDTRSRYRVWQDVYHRTAAEVISDYVKLTVIADFLIVSLKEL